MSEYMYMMVSLDSKFKTNRENIERIHKHLDLERFQTHYMEPT